MEKSALTKEKINIQLNDVRKESRKRFYESKKKNEKRVPTETEYLTTENVEKVSSIRQWKKVTTLIVGDSVLAGIEQKRIGTNSSVNETSRDILNEILSLKNLIEKLRPKCKVIVSNIIYRSDNGKDFLTVILNLNDHLDALSIDVVDNRNIGGNCLTNSGLYLNSTGYAKLAINFIKKMKTLSKN